ncbi:NADH peroxidase [Opitutaceae bacterium EW11]|nr:NADH peroxidase [Opitutaceae bacterium EW11]
MDSTSSSLRLVIVGGVAAGASAAARARRLSENASITLLERGPDVSFANCGLPYHVGGEIADRAALAVQTPQTLKALLNIDVRTNTEVLEIDRPSKRVRIRNGATAELEWLPYDKLVLATGAAPVKPVLPGADDPRIHTLRSLADMDRLKRFAEQAERIAVIGAGFIGLEVAEQLNRLGKRVAIVELQDQVLPLLDGSMTNLVRDELRRHGVEVILSDSVSRFDPSPSSLVCRLGSGRTIEADLVVMSVGIRPESALARAAGLVLGPRGHIRVDRYLRTSDPDVYAAGDAVETEDFVTGEFVAVALGGPANRQGRLAADHIFRPGQTKPYLGTLGTAIVRVFDVAAGLTGWSEKRLAAAGRPFEAVVVNDNQHAGYFPGAKPLALKLVWDPQTGRVLGAQAAGLDGVDKRLDVIATAIMGGLTIDDLAQLELSYAPPFGAAKDIVNLAGFAACNIRDGLLKAVDRLPAPGSAQVLDVRPKPLAKAYPVPAEGVLNIPLAELRGRMGELDAGRPVVTVCALGKTAYFAARVLSQRGFRVSSLTGGMRGSIDPRSPAKLPTA